MAFLPHRIYITIFPLVLFPDDTLSYSHVGPPCPTLSRHLMQCLVFARCFSRVIDYCPEDAEGRTNLGNKDRAERS